MRSKDSRAILRQNPDYVAKWRDYDKNKKKEYRRLNTEYAQRQRTGVNLYQFHRRRNDPDWAISENIRKLNFQKYRWAADPDFRQESMKRSIQYKKTIQKKQLNMNEHL